MFWQKGFLGESHINVLFLPYPMPPDSKKGLTVKKDENFSEWYSQLCLEPGAQLADIRYGIQGFIVIRPLAFRIIRKIYDAFDQEIEKDGHHPFLFPTVIHEENLRKEKEHSGFIPEVFWVTEAGQQKLEEKIALRPTGETAIYPMYALWIRSYKDLPYKGYQSRITVFRNEMVTRPFIRGREFCFYETHDVFSDHEGVLNQIQKDMEIMKKIIWEKLKIPFLFFKRPEWDHFLGANATYVSDTLLPDGKRLQISSTHDLGQNFAKAYNLKFMDKDKKEKYCWQSTFGPGISRIFASLVAIHGDDKGLVLPFDFAPCQIVIIPILFSNKKDLNLKILQFCKDIERTLSQKGYAVELDDSENTSGFKYNEWEMKGVPLYIEIGPKEVEKKTATLKRRTSTAKFQVPFSQLLFEIEKQSKELDEDIEKNALQYFKENTKTANSFDDLQKILETYRGFVKVHFCSTEQGGRKCAEVLKEKTNGGNVCGVLFENSEKAKSNSACIVCKKKANDVVYVAKSY